MFETPKSLFLTHALYRMWVRGGILFITVIQISRWTEKPAFYDSPSQTLTPRFAVVGEEKADNRALTVKLLHPEVTHITYAHIPLSKARHMSIPNSKRYVPIERELKILVSTSDVYCNERKHE